MRGFFGVLLLGLVALVGGLIGYQAGLTSTAATAGNAVIVTGGFPGFGTLCFLLFIGFLFFAFAGRRRAWGGHGHWGSGYGRGPWGGPMGGGFGPGGPGGTGSGPDASSDPRRQWIAEMHRSLHEAEAKSAGTTGWTTGAQRTNPTDPTNTPTAG